MSLQPRSTLHAFIMREAASTGQRKEKPTPAQRAYLQRAELEISFCDTDLPPDRGHRWSTHAACERRGWVKVNLNYYPHVISLTDDGRTAIGLTREARHG